MDSPAGPQRPYQALSEECHRRAQTLGARETWLGNARTIAFLVAIGLVVVGIANESLSRPAYIAAGLTFLLLVVLGSFHEQVLEDLDRNRKLRQINEEQLARLRRAWHDLPAANIACPEHHAAVANDLDLLGPASVFQFINQANTPMGRDTLLAWLLEPAAPSEIAARQEAVAELAPLLDPMQELNLRGRQLSGSVGGPDRFVDWAEQSPWFAERTWLRYISRVLPVAIVILAILTAVGSVPLHVGAIVVLALLAGNLALIVAYTGTIHDMFDQVSSRDGEVRHYQALFELLIALPATSNRLRAIEQDANRKQGGVLAALSDLHRVMTLAGLRHSGLLYLPLYVPLQFVLLWDFHILAALERWQARNGPHVRKWFDALGQFEALASLASVHRDYPEWAFPVVAPDTERLAAQDLGHPLLPDDTRVTNDVEVGPAGTLLLVTGSNMSGKSTLLRAIGVNVALAQAGAPVCASRFTLPPLAVTTSMRIRDSLEEGMSFYMAELKRLKQIVDLAREHEVRPDRRLLYLLDEILLGTNSRERHIAVIRVLAHLLARGAIGAVSTHDLELATSQPLVGNCETVHFRETITAGRMTFDYRMHAGVATTSNAIRLLEMVGLGDDA